MPNFDDLFVVVDEDFDTVQVRPRAPIQGMDPEAIRQTKYAPRKFRVRTSIAHALALYVERVRFPVDIPVAPGVASLLPAGKVLVPQSEITDFIPAAMYKNLFWGLTSDDFFQDSSYEGTVIGFLAETGNFDLRGRQGANQQVTAVEVTVESAPARTTLDAAMRLWSLFLEKIGFTVESTLVDPASGHALKVRQADLAVQQVKPIDEPRIVERVGAGRTKASFRLMAHYVRFI